MVRFAKTVIKSYIYGRKSNNNNTTLQCLQDILQVFLFRQIEITINQPAFTSSVGGYSSYLAYPIDPKDVVTRLEAQFHFSSPSRDQVALLFFIGQEGLHEYGSDYVAISYVKGHILLTWDLGSGEYSNVTYVFTENV